ncbi:hypothetical protein ABQF17_15010 [Mycolicibacterium elephantis]
MTQTNTATVETLAAEVRVLMVGSRQVTLSVAKQLDRISCYSYGADAIVPFGRVRTGRTVTLERELRGKPERITRRHTNGWGDGKWYESYETTPRLEVIGRSKLPEHQGSLAIYEIDNFSDYVSSCNESERPEIKAEIAALEALPLIVLAGLK